MISLLSAISEKTTISDDLKTAVEKAFERIKLPKGEILLSDGKHCKHLYFLESGTIRSYYMTDGLEVTTWFYKEDSFFSSWFSFYSCQPGYETIEVLEESVAYRIHHDAYEALLNQFPMFERFARVLAQEQVALIDSFSKGYMFLSAKEKYELTLQYIPDIEQRVKLGQLASFLGISQETLSRVRAKK